MPSFKVPEYVPDKELALCQFEDLLSEAPSLKDWLSETGAEDALFYILGSSRCFGTLLLRYPQWVESLFSPHGLGPFDYSQHLSRLSPLVGRYSREKENRDHLLGSLRKYKQLEHLRIGIRDLLGEGETSDILVELSDLADGVIEVALRFSFIEMTERFGFPTHQGRGTGFSVIGLGKLGGRELNFNSDVDLIYVYETEKGKTTGPRVVNNHEFFVRLFERLTNILSAVTPDGQIYKVDLRLRPEGNRGDITLPLRSYEIYYESWGQSWERAALIKARHVAGDEDLGRSFINVIRPFVFRKYLDLKALEEIRELKAKIDVEARKRERGFDVKLGRGGIREIEFVVQTIQLLYGGKTPWLMEANTPKALHRIMDKGPLSRRDCETLIRAYLFLRRLENRLQMVDCQQTHILSAHVEGREKIARMMDFRGYLLSQFEKELSYYTEEVARIFQEFFSSPARVDHVVKLNNKKKRRLLASSGFADISKAIRNIRLLSEGRAFEHPSSESKRLFNRLLPRLLQVSSQTVSPDWVLDHLESLVASLKEGRRTFYAMLLENQGVLEPLVRIMGNSEYLSHHLISHPELIDYLSDPAFIYGLGSSSQLEGELEEALLQRHLASFEEKLNELRRWKQRETFRIGMGDLFGGYPLQKVTYLWTKVADVVVRLVYHWLRSSIPLDGEFCILALGKWGSGELTYHSDLDLVFLSHGEASKENVEAFNKLASRVVWAISSMSKEGTLFKVDLRLRPHGAHGEMVQSLEEFKSYLKRMARTWERQAFIKARPVVGDRELIENLEEVLTHFLFGHPYERKRLAQDIWEMRSKVEHELGGTPYHIKYSRGGLVDVEFLLQFWQLLWGHENPALRKRSTLGALARMRLSGLLDERVFRKLREGYLFLRQVENRLRVLYDLPTSKIPSEGKDCEKLARALHFPNALAFMERFQEITENNRALFESALLTESR